ncbi:OLFR [Mytilus coruscus]|uniref:OLFR n=1 Tax=Mytilus coruscus TaxID=42192 RepID=A0A6J8E8E1_MYTCO|nr:OLFR [Mytilus coruscus]
MYLYATPLMENKTDNQTLSITNVGMFYILIGTAITPLCSAFLNIIFMVVLFRSHSLRNSRFHFLTLCLSIGDFLTMILTFALLLNSLLEELKLHVHYLCRLLSLLVYCSVLFSLCQTLLICVERYLATSVTNNLRRNVLAQKKLILLLFVLCVLYTSVLLGLGGFSLQSGCLGNQYTSLHMIFSEVPLILLFIAITVIYIITAVRIKQIITRVTFINNDTSSLQLSRRIIRLKINLFTLGLVLLILAISVVPRVAVALIGQSQNGNVGNVTLVIPPIFNPIIYCIRFVEVRNMLKPNCICRTTNKRSTGNSISMVQESFNIPRSQENSISLVQESLNIPRSLENSISVVRESFDIPLAPGNSISVVHESFNIPLEAETSKETNS